MYFILITINNSINIKNYQRSLTKSIVPYQYNVNEPVSHYAWNPVLPPNINSSIKLTAVLRRSVHGARQ